MLLFNYNIILIIISTFFVTISAQICPQNWWPLAVSNSFLNDVVKGNNINAISGVSFAIDRITSPANLNSVYIKGANTLITTAANYISFLTLPTDTYFSSTSFTITFWINVATIPGAGKQARVIDFSDVASKTNGIAVWIKRGTNAANAAITIESIRAGAALTVADGGAGFVPGWTHVAITVSTSGSPATITTAIYYNGVTTGITLSPSATAITALPAITTSFTTNFIGKGTTPASPAETDANLDAQLNDVKIFNSALSPTQVTTQFNSEKPTRSFSCTSSSSSINSQYFYIVLLAILGSFF